MPPCSLGLRARGRFAAKPALGSKVWERWNVPAWHFGQGMRNFHSIVVDTEMPAILLFTVPQPI